MFAFRTIKILNLSKNLINIFEINRKSLPSIFIRRKNSTLSGIENFNLENEISNMKEIYPSVKKELLENIPLYMDKLKFEEFLDYNFHVTHRRGLFRSTIYLYRNLTSTLFKRIPTSEEEYVLSILNELFGSIVLIVDDIMDKSNFRFGFPTWHTFNDEYEVLNYYVPALYSSLTSFISKNYETYSYYKNLSALYHKCGYNICVSVCWDYLSLKLQKNIDWMEFYRSLLYFKGTYFYEIPIKSILFSIGYEEIPNEKEFNDLLVKIGYYIQATNDFLDHFGISDKTGKGLDDDMKTGIIGWPVVYAWKYSSDEQRKLIAEHYGKGNKESMDIVSGIYENLNLRQKFNEFDEECQLEITNGLKCIPDTNMQILASKATQMIKLYGRRNILK